MNNIIELIRADKHRLDILAVVASLQLPDCYIAAGFVRNLVWDYMHGFPPTALNDVDIIYFSKSLINEDILLAALCSSFPNVNWQLKNQALMHKRNLDPPYENSIGAMAHWPEIETALGARLEANGKIVVVSPFDKNYIFNGFITHNTKREKSVFLKRIEKKQWLEAWPKLQVKL
ncbi:MAG: nucleotidyltransferase family protein [Pseudomonadota bacterium]